jgi:ferredoxin
MDEYTLDPELVKKCNPGMTDFGSGNVIALTSQCLHNAREPSDCQICVEACPVDALVPMSKQRPRATADCLKCGFCISICPLNALVATTRTIQQILRLVLQATLRVEQLTFTCQRSLALLRLEAESSEPELALADLELLTQAQTTESLFVLPCLGMLSPELWFTALNEVGISRLQQLYVYLPEQQCSLCPANSKGQVEDLMATAIETAEQWSKQSVELIEEASEVPQYHHANVREYLTSDRDVDRRGVFTGFISELKRSWDETTRSGNRAQDETLRIQARKQTINRTLLADDLKSTITGSEKPIVAPFRQALVEAIGRHPANAANVELLVSETDDSRCIGCQKCLSVCPLHARLMIDGTAYADPLYCLGCSACIQACPKQACTFIRITGQTYLRDD